jgi:hypothetical protein
MKGRSTVACGVVDCLVARPVSGLEGVAWFIDATAASAVGGCSAVGPCSPARASSASGTSAVGP